MNIKEITQFAKETLLEVGEHPPTFFVERRQGISAVVLADFDSNKDLHSFLIGRKVAQERRWKVREIKEIIFIVEAWFSENADVCPSEDPDRREVLSVARLAVKPRLFGKSGLVMTMQYIEMIRDGSGTLVDLLPHDEMQPCHHIILQAFLAGIISKGYSDKHMAAMKMVMEGDKR